MVEPGQAVGEAHRPGSSPRRVCGSVVADAKSTTAGREDRATGGKGRAWGSGRATQALTTTNDLWRPFVVADAECTTVAAKAVSKNHVEIRRRRR
jgi:hypothetical protein